MYRLLGANGCKQRILKSILVKWPTAEDIYPRNLQPEITKKMIDLVSPERRSHNFCALQY